MKEKFVQRRVSAPTPIDRIRDGALIFAGTLLVATLGYRFLFRRSWIDSLYMVVITVTSVGYGDSHDGQPPSDPERLFTIAVIVIGVTAGVYTIGGFLQMITEGEVQRALGLRKMTRGIQRLSDHVIICGFGRIGQILAHDLERQEQDFVLIENDPERVTEATARYYLVINGDATEEAVLHNAGIERAKSLVSSLPSDADNVFITLTARNLRPDIQIIARAEKRSSEKKLVQAGANRVVMPASTGAIQMAQMITRPTTADFFELVADRTQLDLELDEICVRHGTLVGKSVAEAEAHRRHRLLVLAIKQADGNMVFNPGADYVFREGDTLVVMGGKQDIDSFQQQYQLHR